MKINPILLVDGYKTSHKSMYPKNTTLVYSNYTCRSVKRMPKEAKNVVVFGTQYMIKYIHDVFKNDFFGVSKEVVCGEAKEYLTKYLGSEYDVSHFEALHDLGYLPIEIKALEEGSITQAGIPLFTIKNTLPEFFWVTNYLETLISTLIWKPVHSASLAYGYKKLLIKYALETDKDNIGFVDFQGHDFSFRGMQSPESAIGSAMGFLTSFKGTDTVPVLQALNYYYKESNTAFSVPASEHSVMCSHGKEGEINTLEYLMDQYPKGILSVVSDTWDLWKLITEYLPTLKDRILSRDGKLVIRPDSGDPVDIICGLNIETIQADSYENFIVIAEDILHEEICEITAHGKYGGDITDRFYYDGKLYDVTYSPDWNRYDKQYYFIDNYGGNKTKAVEIEAKPQYKGVIELLWDIFGGTVNEQGYKVLDSHIGAIYGDSITLERAEEICKRLKAKGFASTNIVLGIGSYSMGYTTRDNQGGAVKSTYVEVNGEAREIFKDPITDDGTKKSAKGLLYVSDNMILTDQVSWKIEQQGMLKTIYKNGSLIKEVTLSEIRNKINSYENII